MLAVYDSGFGGLTFLKEYLRVLPEYDYLYLGDNARTPYGNRSQETVTRFSEQAVEYLFGQGSALGTSEKQSNKMTKTDLIQEFDLRLGTSQNRCSARRQAVSDGVVLGCTTTRKRRSQRSNARFSEVPLVSVACNTVSTLALRHLQEKYLRQPKVTDQKILGVVRPVVEEAVKVTRYGRIGVACTRGTFNSNAFEAELHKLNPNLKVFSQACPLLVPLVEENWHHKPEARMILKKYLRHLKSCQIDTLILGCTHYPFLIKDFQRYMGKNVKVLNTPEITAHSLKDYLQRHPEIESKLTKKGRRIFLTTDDPGRFKEVGERFLGQGMDEIKKVSLS